MKFYQSPRWTNEYFDCSMPMTFDTYNKCSYNCMYCFSYYQKSHDNSPTNNTGRKDYQRKPLKYVNVDRIKKLFKGELPKSQFNDFIKMRKVMQWGGLADQFDEYERKTGKTLELMKFFDEIDYPLSFSTKSHWFVNDDRYMSLIRKHAHNWHFKISIIGLDPKKTKMIERGCPTPIERLDTIRKLADAGVHVTLRLRPYIIGLSDTDSDELLELAREAGADSVSTEFFCLEQRADLYLKKRYKEMSKALKYDILQFYKRNSVKTGYLRLNRELKKEHFDKLEQKCKALGMRFYVSDASCKEKCNNGSCCGLPTNFNYSTGQLTEAILIAKYKGKVKLSDIEPQMEYLKSIKWARAEGLNTKSNLARLKHHNLTLFDVFKNTWNQPNKVNSPYKYFGGKLIPKELDKEGNIIYYYNKEANEK